MDCWTRGRIIGQGSTATVSLATSLRSGDVMAVKSAELSQSEFLQREERILSSLKSPYVVCYKGCGVTRESNKLMYNLFLEYMSGGSLTEAIQAGGGGRLEESRIGYYTCQLVRGLNYLHSNGLVHCDMKSSNVLIGETGAKIADFGCAKRVVDEAVEMAGTIGGTPMFMAPEVARGEEQRFASDIWGLGCTVIEMATGCGPWANVKDPVSAMYRIGFIDDLPEFPCSLSDQAKDFLDKCLRRDPKQRWTAEQLLGHPFLEKYAKQVQESNNNNNEAAISSSSYSPTSILDQDIWTSFDSNESEDLDSLIDAYETPSSASERIRRLGLISEGPSWGFHDGDDWISVRANCCEEEEEEGDTIMAEIGSNRDDVVLDDEDDHSSKSSGDNLGDCKFGRDRFLVRDDRDKTLICYNSRLFLEE